MKFIVIVFLAVALSIDAVVVKKPGKRVQQNQKYIVYPGLDVDNNVAAGWMNGYSSPFNVFFGPQPYIVGWVGVDEGDYYDDEYQEEEYHNDIAVAEAPHDEVTQDRG